MAVGEDVRALIARRAEQVLGKLLRARRIVEQS